MIADNIGLNTTHVVASTGMSPAAVAAKLGQEEDELQLPEGVHFVNSHFVPSCNAEGRLLPPTQCAFMHHPSIHNFGEMHVHCGKDTSELSHCGEAQQKRYVLAIGREKSVVHPNAGLCRFLVPLLQKPESKGAAENANSSQRDQQQADPPAADEAPAAEETAKRAPSSSITQEAVASQVSPPHLTHIHTSSGSQELHQNVQ